MILSYDKVLCHSLSDMSGRSRSSQLTLYNEFTIAEFPIVIERFCRSITSCFCRLFALNGLLVILWISTRISDVGEIYLGKESLQNAYILRKQGTYKRWVGFQVWLSFLSSGFLQTTPADTSDLKHLED